MHKWSNRVDILVFLMFIKVNFNNNLELKIIIKEYLSILQKLLDNKLYLIKNVSIQILLNLSLTKLKTKI
jgi:hypothetical protein